MEIRKASPVTLLCCWLAKFNTPLSINTITRINIKINASTNKVNLYTRLSELSYLQGEPQLRAELKQEISDFCVDEELGFDLSGKGEHLCVQVRKKDFSTNEVAKKLSDLTGAEIHKISYSGMKDKCAECTQWFSIQLPITTSRSKQLQLDAAILQPLLKSENGNSSEHKPVVKELVILKFQRNSRKIKLGSHKLNHFKILLRNCVGSKDDFDARLSSMLTKGIPNYFGPQRFGNNLSNLVQVSELMDAALNNAGEVSVNDESNAERGVDLGRRKRSMLFSAARSYLFNQLLSERLESQTWSQYIKGDVLNLHGTNRFFALKADQSWDKELQERLNTFDIHITGPLPGLRDPKDRYLCRGEAADIEDATLKLHDGLLLGLKYFALRESRRPLRFLPSNLHWDWVTEKDLELTFALPRGAYATSLLRELCVTD